MALKKRLFRDLKVGDLFVVDTDTQQHRKASEQKAVRQAANGGDAQDPDAKWRVTPSRPVFVVVPDPTAEELLQDKKRAFRRALDTMTSTANGSLADFMQALHKDPSQAMRWHGDSALKAGAMLAVVARVSKMLAATDADFEHAVKVCRDEAWRYARYNHHSTSAAANLTAEHEAGAFAELVDVWDRN